MHLLFAVLLGVTQHWLVVADLHLNPFDRSSIPSSYKTDSNWELVHATIAQMHAAEPAPDVVVIAGDQLAHQWAAKARAAGRDPGAAAQETFARLARVFDQAFPHAQFVIAMGNNDDPCGDYRTGKDSPYLASVAKSWAPLVDRHGAAPRFSQTFAHAGYYSARLPGGRTALVLDDVYFSMFYRACAHGGAGNEQFAWFEAQLQGMRSGKTAIPVLHIPPGVDPVSTLIAHRFVIVPYWNSGARKRFERDMQRFANVIPFGIAAHMHRSGFRLSGGVPLLIASSVSPIYGNNPSFDELTFDDGPAPSVETYVLDLTSMQWSKSNAFAKLAGTARFDAASVRSAHDRIAADDGARTLWERAMAGDSDAWYGVRASWRAYWCAETETGSAYISCAGDRRRTTFAYALAAGAIAVALALVVWYSRKRWKQRRSSSG